MQKKLIIAGLTLTTLVSAALPGLARPAHPRVNEVNGRRENQRKRIQEGIKNGTISKSELSSLRQEGKSIHQQEQSMRAADGGHLTKQDQQTLNQELNQRSKDIYTDKHN